MKSTSEAGQSNDVEILTAQESLDLIDGCGEIVDRLTVAAETIGRGRNTFADSLEVEREIESRSGIESWIVHTPKAPCSCELRSGRGRVGLVVFVVATAEQIPEREHEHHARAETDRARLDQHRANGHSSPSACAPSLSTSLV